MTELHAPWVVLKFGGTSVATAKNWNSIEQIVSKHRKGGKRIVIVHSALALISDLLTRAIQDAISGQHETTTQRIWAIHQQLGEALAIEYESLLKPDIHTLEQLLSGITLTGEASARVRAKVMCLGELMATRMGAARLQQSGLPCTWIDARQHLFASKTTRESEAYQYSEALCDDRPDAGFQQKLRDIDTPIVLTQGFIAGNEAAETVLLGRGGSDTSAALFAAKLQAEFLEIWTDVPGMYSADPRRIPSARLLKDLSYDEAQEIASMGAKVIHPQAIPPVRRAGVPVLIKSTAMPHLGGTLISANPLDTSPRVKAIAVRSGITLVSMTSSAMWKVPGFLATAFTAFADNDLSIDLVSTSETSVTVSLDAQQELETENLTRLIADLEGFCRVEAIKGCATVSLVGREIRTILHKLTPALELFREHPVRLLSQAANDLNFTVVVDEEQAHTLAARLHDIMVEVEIDDRVFGPASDAGDQPSPSTNAQPIWWKDKRQRLLDLMQDKQAAFVYDLETIDKRATSLADLTSVSRSFYAMKANGHPAVLERVLDAGMGIECVSRGEIEHIMQHFPDIDRNLLLFTPNFASRSEYEFARKSDIRITLDSLHPIAQWPELFKNAKLNLRVDPERSRGHHRHVHTAGVRAKFGIPATDIPQICQLVEDAGAIIDGLHAHAGSGILDPDHWKEIGTYLTRLQEHFPKLTQINLGGGLGIPERPGAPSLDMEALDAGLLSIKKHCQNIELWLEPGRYLVAEAGVLLARVTQVKTKQQIRYVGVETGMNSLLRPALYSARHEIFNLTRLDEAVEPHPVNVVGPICESADVLGVNRHLPPTCEGDILLIADAGAYGAVMSSSYNMRQPAEELVI
ncbi:MAG: diaminopimelate decarboxylase [Robiginitomaculum sp.]|nr:MAG: diaminopimelate decarboxylase [Robiginitomaculum sp.]